jgi:hypothetical protein
LHGGGVRVFGTQSVGFAQAMRDGQIIFANRPLQKLPDGGSMVIAAFGGKIGKRTCKGSKCCFSPCWCGDLW